MTALDELSKLRGILDKLGYRAPLPPDAEPLVSHLLEDLVSSTKQLKQVKEELTLTQKVSSTHNKFSLMIGSFCV